jgi:acyl transferase domain-containing protein
VVPAALLGHSLGEITAACVAGVFDLPGAARFVAARGRAMQDCPTGTMLALGCDEASALGFVTDSGLELELSAVNSAESCVLAGTHSAVAAFRVWLGDRVFSSVLRTSHAFHSALMEPALPRLTAALRDCELRSPAVPFASNVTGRVIAADAPIVAAMFVEQVRQPVRFGDAVAAVAERVPGAVLVEVGPGRILSALVEAAGLTAVPVSPARTAHPDEEVLMGLGRLWSLGLAVAPVDLCTAGRRIHLPGYPFAGPRWLAPEAAASAPARPAVTSATTSSNGTAEVSAGAVLTPDPKPEARVLLAGLWTELLGHAGPGDDADFFELGGDSLLITHLARRIHQELGVRVPLRTMMAARTLGRQTGIVLDLLAQALQPIGSEERS